MIRRQKFQRLTKIKFNNSAEQAPKMVHSLTGEDKLIYLVTKTSIYRWRPRITTNNCWISPMWMNVR